MYVILLLEGVAAIRLNFLLYGPPSFFCFDLHCFPSDGSAMNEGRFSVQQFNLPNAHKIEVCHDKKH